MKIEFVGGSRDGDELEISPSANYRLLCPIPVQPVKISSWPGLAELSEKSLLCELYEYMPDGKYHFMGYK
jgi:hypothetical protein